MGPELKPGDIVRLKKPHPCGGNRWRVNRIGGDIGLHCQTCGHYVTAPRRGIARRIREVIRAGPAGDGGEQTAS